MIRQHWKLQDTPTLDNLRGNGPVWIRILRLCDAIASGIGEIFFDSRDGATENPILIDCKQGQRLNKISKLV
jgi:hypothetical protein